MPWDRNGNWIPGGALQKTSRGATDTGVVSGSQGIGTVAGGYQAPPGIDTTIPDWKKQYDERGLPVGKPREQNVFGERAVVGAPMSIAERAYWAANPGGVPASSFYGFDPTGPGTAGGRPTITPAVGAPPSAAIDTDSLIANLRQRRDELGSARMGLENRRAQAIHDLGLERPGHRGRLTPRARALGETIKAIDAQERDLSQQERFADREAGMRVNAAFRNNQIATKNLDEQRKEQTAIHATNVQNGLARIELRYKHGTTEFYDALAQLTDANPLYIHNASAAAAVRKASEFHDAQAPKLTNQAVMRYSKLQADILAHEEASKAEEALNIKGKQPNKAYSNAPALHAAQLEAAALEKRFPGLSDFHQQQQQQTTTPPATAPTATPATVGQNNLNISSDAEYQQLPSGSIFVGPDGVKRRKP